VIRGVARPDRATAAWCSSRPRRAAPRYLAGADLAGERSIDRTRPGRVAPLSGLAGGSRRRTASTFVRPAPAAHADRELVCAQPRRRVEGAPHRRVPRTRRPPPCSGRVAGRSLQEMQVHMLRLSGSGGARRRGDERFAGWCLRRLSTTGLAARVVRAPAQRRRERWPTACTGPWSERRRSLGGRRPRPSLRPTVDDWSERRTPATSAGRQVGPRRDRARRRALGRVYGQRPWTTP